MRKPTTGEPCSGEPHARFGGQGGKGLPDPYHIHQDTHIIEDLCRTQVKIGALLGE